MSGEKDKEGDGSSGWLGATVEDMGGVADPQTHYGLNLFSGDKSADQEQATGQTNLPEVDLENRLGDLKLHLIPYIPMRPLPDNSIERLADSIDQILMNDDPGHAREFWSFEVSAGDSAKIKAIVESYNPYEIMASMLDVIYQKAAQVLGPHGDADQQMMHKDTFFSLKRRAQTTGYKADYNNNYTPEEKNEMRIREWEAAKKIFEAIPENRIAKSERTSMAKIGEILGVPEKWYHAYREIKGSEDDLNNYKRLSIEPTLADYKLESGEWLGLLRDADNIGLSTEQIIHLMTETEVDLLKRLGKEILSGKVEGINTADKNFKQKAIKRFVKDAVRYTAAVYSAAHYDAFAKLTSLKEHLGYVDESSAPAVTAEQKFMALFEKFSGALKVRVSDVDYGYFTRKGHEEYKRVIDGDDKNAREQHEKIMRSTTMKPEDVIRYAESRGFVLLNQLKGEDLVTKYNLSAEKIPVTMFHPIAKNGAIRYHIFEDDTALISTDGKSYYVELDNFGQFVLENGLPTEIGHDNGVRGFEVDMSDMETMIFTKKGYIDQKKADLEDKVERKKPEAVPIHLADIESVSLGYLKKWGFESLLCSPTRLVTPSQLYQMGLQRKGFTFRKEDLEGSKYLALPVLESRTAHDLGVNDFYTEFLVAKRKDGAAIRKLNTGLMIPVELAALFERKDLANADNEQFGMKAHPTRLFRTASGSDANEAYITIGYDLYNTTGMSSWLTVPGKRLPINFLPFGATLATKEDMYRITPYNWGDQITNPKSFETKDGIEILAKGQPVELKTVYKR